MSCDMWFGTKDYAQFIRTPQTGADVSPQAWGSSGTLLNGSGYAFNSFNSHKEYSFSWGATAAREAAQTMKSYFEGSFGRGKLHFVDPLTYSTNVLPARWADPSITADFEGPQLVPGVDPYTVPTSNFQWLRLPVRTTVFDLDSVQPVANTVFLPEAENLFTNPNLVGSGSYATVAENLFTNPRLKGDGTWAEVRRNLFTDPAPGSSAGFTSAGSAVIGYNTSERSVTVLTNGAAQSGVNVRAAGVGEVDVPYSAGMWVKAPAGAQMYAHLRVLAQPAGSVTTSFEGTGGWSWLALEGAEAPTSAATFTELSVRSASAGDPFQFEVRRLTLEKAPILGPYFDGSSTPATAVGVDQPEDFRWRWLGAENESESVMEIERVAGFTSVGCVTGASSRDGKPAARLIPTRTSGAVGYSIFAIPASARSGGTILGTAHIDEPLTGALANRMILRARLPEQRSPSPANLAGSYPIRLEYSALTESYAVDLYHGGYVGAGDVWWTDIGIFAGDYPYEAFNGDSDPADTGITQPEDFRIRWTGAVDNSTSVMEIETVRGFVMEGSSAGTTIAGVSTWNGSPSVRVIALADNPSGRARFRIPSGSVRDDGTWKATLHRPEIIPGGNERIGAGDLLRTTGTDTPSPGDFLLTHRWGGDSGNPSLTAFYNAYLYGSGIGGTSAWYTDVGLFAGDYTGPWFSGDSEIPGKVTRWTGAPDNSTSQIGVLQPVSTPSVNEENSVFVPIPDGMQLSVGAFYSGSPEAGVYVVNATQGGTPGMNITRLQPLTPSDTNILPNVFTKAPGDIGVYIVFGKLESVDALLNVTAIHARLSLIGVNPQGENYWLGGQGNEGVRFVQPPTYINHTGVNGGQVEYAATFKESIH